MTSKEEQFLSLVIKAMNNKNLIQFVYENKLRIIEPFLVGELYSKYENHLVEGAYAVRGWLVRGYSSKNLDVKKGDRWRIYELDKMSDLLILNETFYDARPLYNPDDSSFKRINLRMEIIKLR